MSILIQFFTVVATEIMRNIFMTVWGRGEWEKGYEQA